MGLPCGNVAKFRKRSKRFAMAVGDPNKDEKRGNPVHAECCPQSEFEASRKSRGSSFVKVAGEGTRKVAGSGSR